MKVTIYCKGLDLVPVGTTYADLQDYKARLVRRMKDDYHRQLVKGRVTLPLDSLEICDYSMRSVGIDVDLDLQYDAEVMLADSLEDALRITSFFTQAFKFAVAMVTRPTAAGGAL